MQTRTNSFLKNTRRFLQNNLFYSFSVAKYTDNIIMPATKKPNKNLGKRMKMFTASSIYKQEFYVLCKHYDSRAQADHQVPVRCTLKRKPFLSSILESNTCFS